MIEWQLAQAKNRFSEVVTLALTKEPQRVRRRNQTVIVLSEADYLLLKNQKTSFVDYLMTGPSFEPLDLSREVTEGREVTL